MKMYKIKEACELLKIGRTTIYDWEKKGIIHFVRIANNIVRISEDEIKRLINNDIGE